MGRKGISATRGRGGKWDLTASLASRDQRDLRWGDDFNIIVHFIIDMIIELLSLVIVFCICE